MKNKILSIILVMMLIIWNIAIVVNAAEFTVTMTPSKTTVAESTEFTVKVKISNIEVGTNGINSLSGDLKYDTNVFETISESNIENMNDWTVSFDESSNKISLTKSTFAKSSQDIFQIAFKTKSGVSGQSGSIAFENITASNSETTLTASDISTSITVGTESSDTNTTNTSESINAITNTSNNTTNNVTNNTTNTSNNITSNNVVNTASGYVNTTTNTTSNDDMPDTGVSDTILILIFLVIGMAFVFYIKIEKLNKEMR